MGKIKGICFMAFLLISLTFFSFNFTVNANGEEIRSLNNSVLDHSLTLTKDTNERALITETTTDFSQFGQTKSEKESEQATFSNTLLSFLTNPIVVTFLLSIGALGLVMELFSPGFGLPGLIGLSSFGLFFFGHIASGFATYESIFIFVIGFALLAAELFIPGGIVGLIGGALMIISLLFAGESVVHMAYSILIAMIIAIIGMVVLMKFFGKNLHVFNKLILRDATTTEEGYVSNVNRVDLLGKSGYTMTPLRPAGTIIIDNERIDVVSEGNYIDSKKKVEVVRVEGSRIVVREIEKGVE